MIGKDKVLIGLGQHISGRTPQRCGNCPYFNGDSGYGVSCRDELLDDLYELLEAQEEAQEPKLLTWRDVIGFVLGCKPVYIEVKESEDKESGDDRWAMMQQYKDSLSNGMLMAKSSYVISEVMFERNYGVTWRCWDKEPSDEQRKEVEWHGDD